MLSFLKKIIPKPIFKFFRPAYHYFLSLLGAILYRFPSRKLVVIGVTGTKGKTTTTEIVSSILEAAGHKTAVQNTVRFKIGEREKRNLFKMSMPGRFFMQKFLRDAVDAGCTHAVIEMTSEGAKQFRHKFIHPDALIFTNLAPEHIESHGSYENYVEAKLSIAKELETTGHEKSFSSKSPRVSSSVETDSARLSSENFSHGQVIVVNKDDKEAEKFLALNIKNKVPYSINNAVAVKSDENGSSFQINKIVIHSKLPGLFNVSNMLGAIALAKFMNLSDEVIKKGIENMNLVRGRMEKIECGQNFDVVVDYAHTPESLKAVYETYKKYHLICILGNTGGGRDTWKRAEMGKIADEYCDQIILTNEDPYDEDPKQIVDQIRIGISKKPLEIIMDRREAIASAIKKASHFDRVRDAASRDGQNKVAVLITGKGTDPYIMGPNGTKEEWDDAEVAKEELEKFQNNFIA